MNLSDQLYKQNRKSKVGRSAGKSAGKKQKGNKNQAKIQINNKSNDEDPFAQFTDATPIWAQKQHCKDK